MNNCFFIALSCFILFFSSCKKPIIKIDDDRFHIKIIDTHKEHLAFYWKDDKSNQLRSFSNLKNYLVLNQKKLTYAMNGGMYLKDGSPQGLYIENNVILKPLDTIQKAFGNFYLQPNGVFGITKNNIPIINTSDKIIVNDLKYATQSGPMLVIDGALHPAFNQGSKNTHIRNAVGVLPDGKLLFAISKKKINFYDLATFFKNQGCKNALYLDGFVSRVYDLDNHIEQMDGDFGVLIGVSKY